MPVMRTRPARGWFRDRKRDMFHYFIGGRNVLSVSGELVWSKSWVGAPGPMRRAMGLLARRLLAQRVSA